MIGALKDASLIGSNPGGRPEFRDEVLRAMTPPIGDVDVRAAIRPGRDDEFDE